MRRSFRKALFLLIAGLAVGVAPVGLFAAGRLDTARDGLGSQLLAPYLDELDARLGALEFEARESERRLAERPAPVTTAVAQPARVDVGRPGELMGTGPGHLSVVSCSKKVGVVFARGERRIRYRQRAGDAPGPVSPIFFAGVREYFAFRNGYARRGQGTIVPLTRPLFVRTTPLAAACRFGPFIFSGVRS